MLLIIGFLAGLGLFIIGMGGIIVSFQEGFTSGSFYFIIWLISGIVMMVASIKKILENMQMNSAGESCFGLVKNVVEESENLFFIEVAIYLPKEDKVEVTSQMVPSPFQKYKKGDFVLVKYLNREVMIKHLVDVNTIPMEIQKKFFTNRTLQTTDVVTNYSIKPMDMPENGTSYSWQDNNKNNNNGLY
jgi:hypothetical protein